MNNLYWLDQIQTKDHQQVGDQALHLSYLGQRGYAIAPSFVVSTTLFRDFLNRIEWSDPLFFDLAQSSLYVNVEDALQLRAIARQIQHTIAATSLPADWLSQLKLAVSQLGSASAVMLRPSLTLAGAKVNGFAPTIHPEAINLLDTHICWTDEKSLEAALKKLWAQIFRARNLLYWQRSNLQLHQIQLAVIVQPVLEATASGYLQRQQTHWEVLATWGLAQAIAYGEVLPDFYQIAVEDGSVKSQKLGSKTIAYRVPQPLLASSETLSSEPLQSYVLSEIQDKQFVLDLADLQQFGQLAQRLTADFSALLVLEWTRSDSTYITQVSTQMSVSLSASSESKNEPTPQIESGSTAIVSGLAAAPGQRTAQATVITDLRPSFSEILPGTILVTPTILPDWLPLLKQTVGIIAEQGGMTSHGAIVAREFGIPAVVGAAQATQRIQTGDWLLVDGDRGEVYLTQPQNEFAQPALIAQNSKLQNSHAEMNTPTPAERCSPIATQLMVNLSQVDRVDQVVSLAIDGVGLLRSELMILSILEGQHPHLWVQQGRQKELSDRLGNQIRQFAEAFAPRPVFYRSLDLRSHEFRSLEGGEVSPETNPMLGVRGTFSYVLNPALFEVELTALRQVQQAGYSNLRLTLPFVRTVAEFVFCRQRVEQSGLTQQPQFQLWIMAEVPSVLFLLPEYVQAGVEGISIGTNDLTQLLLGVDRDQSLMASAFDERHPAVLRAIDHLIKTARRLKIPCSICGGASIQHPELVDRLIQSGITTISVDANAVEATHQAIARAEQRLLIEGSRRLNYDRSISELAPFFE
ncbi:putative PEP-binding protein [Phormidesmis priestleyi]